MDFDLNIFKRIREAYSKVFHSAPEGIWNNVSNELDALKLSDQRAEEKVQNEFRNTQYVAPDLWDSIEKQLVIDQTWKNIEIAENRRSRRRVLALVWLPIVLILLGSGLVYYAYVHSSKVEDVAVKDHLRYKSADQIESTEFTPSIEHIDDENEKSEVQDRVSSENVSIQILKDVLTPRPLVVEKDLVFNPNIDLRSDLIKLPGLSKIDISGIEYKLEISSLPLKDVHFISSTSGSVNGKWTVGVFTSINYPSVNNNVSREGERQQSLVETELTFNINAGVQAQYSLNSRTYLMAQFHLNNVKRQDYHQFDQGHYVAKSNLFLYDKLNLAIMRNLFMKGANRFTINAGGYGSRLKLARSLENGKLSDIGGEYKSVDLGLTIGIGMEHNWKSISTHVGVQSDQGLLNIYKGNSIKPKEFDVTRLNNFYLTIGLNYSL